MSQKFEFRATRGLCTLRYSRVAKQVLREELSTVVAAGAIPAMMVMLLGTTLQISYLTNAETSIFAMLTGIAVYVFLRTMDRLCG